VDQEGYVLDVLVQSRPDKKAAKRLLGKLLRKQERAPRVPITGKLKNYATARREIIPCVEHRQHKGLNNLAENSHQPTPDESGSRNGLSRRGTCSGFFLSPIRSPMFLPAIPAKTPPPGFEPPAVKHSPPGPRSPA
jgi:putative transposase